LKEAEINVNDYGNIGMNYSYQKDKKRRATCLCSWCLSIKRLTLQISHYIALTGQDALSFHQNSSFQ